MPESNEASNETGYWVTGLPASERQERLSLCSGFEDGCGVSPSSIRLTIDRRNSTGRGEVV